MAKANPAPNSKALGPTFDILDQAQSKRRNSTWRRNNREITAAYTTFYKQFKKEPTLDELANATGLSRTTVHAHFAHMEVEPMFEDLKKEFAMFAGDIFLAIVAGAVKGNSRSQELYLRIVLKWNPEMELPTDAKLERGLAEALEALDEEDDADNSFAK